MRRAEACRADCTTFAGSVRLIPVRWEEHIAITPGVRGGKACIKGTRITVYDVLEYLAGGMTASQMLADFPSLTADDIRACLSFDVARERRRSAPSAG